MQNTVWVDLLTYTFAFDCQVANHIVYYRQSKVNYFERVELMTAQVAYNFVYLFRKNLISFAQLRKLFCCSPTGSALNQSLSPAGSAIVVNKSDLSNSCGLYFVTLAQKVNNSILHTYQEKQKHFFLHSTHASLINCFQMSFL